MMVKPFNCRGHRWNEIRKEENEIFDASFVVIARPVSYSFLRRHGQMATAIDVKRSELPKKYQNIEV